MLSGESESVEREFIPKLIGAIGRWELFPGMFIVGNIELDRYIRVPAESVEPVWRAIQYCDGNRSVTEIARLILASGWNFDVAGLYRKLADAGLPNPKVQIVMEPAWSPQRISEAGRKVLGI